MREEKYDISFIFLAEEKINSILVRQKKNQKMKKR